MEHVLLLMLLAGVGHALFPAAETKCNATHESSLCSASLGGTVYMQMMTNASGLRLECKKHLPTGSTKVFSLKKGNVTIQESLRNRTKFFINNGTLKISHVEKEDSGQYKVDIFDLNGVLLRKIEVKLDVQENYYYILVSACSAAGVLLIAVILCCVCQRARRKKKADKKARAKNETSLFSTTPDLSDLS